MQEKENKRFFEKLRGRFAKVTVKETGKDLWFLSGWIRVVTPNNFLVLESGGKLLVVNLRFVTKIEVNLNVKK